VLEKTMTNRLDRIAEKLGATFVDDVPVVGGGAFGAARLAGIVAELQMRLKPGQGIRPGRPSDPTWIETPKVPMSEATFLQLTRLAERASRSGRKVSPMQLAAQIIEDAVAQLPVE